MTGRKYNREEHRKKVIGGIKDSISSSSNNKTTISQEVEVGTKIEAEEAMIISEVVMIIREVVVDMITIIIKAEAVMITIEEAIKKVAEVVMIVLKVEEAIKSAQLVNYNKTLMNP